MASRAPLTENVGLTRITTGTTALSATAIRLISASSSRDSQMIAAMPSRTQAVSSAGLLPGPRKSVSCGSTPARRAVASSASDDTSALAPSECSSAQMETFGLDFSEKNTSMAGCSRCRNCVNWPRRTAPS